MIWRFWWMEVRFARDKNSSSLSHTSLHLCWTWHGGRSGAWMVKCNSIWIKWSWMMGNVLSLLFMDGCVGMTLNCLNGKSFLRGRGRGMTNFQLCGSGNWETEDHPLIKSKKWNFCQRQSGLPLSHIWGGSNLITIEVSNLQGRGLSPVYNALFHSSPDTDIWHQDTSQLSHSSHPLSPVTGAHRYHEHESEKQTSLLTFIWSYGAISEEFRANGTLRCAKKLNTNPVHRTQQW